MKIIAPIQPRNANGTFGPHSVIEEEKAAIAIAEADAAAAAARA